MSSIVWPSRFRRDPRVPSCGEQPLVTEATVVSYVWASPNLTVTFDVPVSLTGLPGWLLNTDETPTAATRPSPKTIMATYTTPGAPTSWTLPQRDPAIRTAVGGYAGHGTFCPPSSTDLFARVLLISSTSEDRSRLRSTANCLDNDRLRLDSVCRGSKVHNGNRPDRSNTMHSDYQKPLINCLGPCRATQLSGAREPNHRNQRAHRIALYNRVDPTVATR